MGQVRSMTRTSTTLLIAAAVYFVTVPVHAHGLSSEFVSFILALLVLTLIAPTLTDFFAIRRWLFADRAWLAAILANLAAYAVAIPVFLALQWLTGAAADALESGAVGAAYGLRTLSPWPEALVAIASMVVTKAAVLRWGFADRLSRPTLGLLSLSTLAGMGAAVGIAALFAYAWAG
jgi:hypothetical protein